MGRGGDGWLATRNEEGTQPERSTPPPTIDLTGLNALVKEPRIAVSWLWDNCLPMAGLSILAAKPKAGKSTVARCLIASVAVGEPFLGRDVTAGKVVYLALEERRDLVAAHFDTMKVPGHNVLVAFSLPGYDVMNAIEAMVREIKPVLVVIDPLQKAMRMSDTNDYAEVSKALYPLGDMARRLGPHIMLVHHLGKRTSTHGDAILGSTALFGAVDTACLLDLDRKRRIFSTLQRYGEAFGETTLVHSMETGWTTVGGAYDAAGRLGQALLTAMADGNEVNRAGLILRVQGKTRDIFTSLELLVDAGLVARTGLGAKGSPFLYRLVANPQAAGDQLALAAEEENSGRRAGAG